MGQASAPLGPAGQLVWQAPKVWDCSTIAGQQARAAAVAAGDVRAVYDEIQLAIAELYDIKNPDKKDLKTDTDVARFAQQLTGGDQDGYGVWVYYSWSGDLVHFPPPGDYALLRTARNRNLITADEQARLAQNTIAVAGMSVGSNVVEALVSSGIGGRLIMIDLDVLEPTNLNRIRAPYHQVGMHKVDALACKISQIDPFIEQIHYKQGLNQAVLDEIIDKYQPTVLVDEMDDVRMKLKLRFAAKAAGLPVIMAADDGDGILLDIERYDQDSSLPILHGKVPEQVIDRILGDKPIPRPELGMLIGRYFVGFENTPLRMFESLAEVGKSLPSWPQLGGAATLAGVTLAYCAKRIILDQPLRAGRFLVGPDAVLNPEIHDPIYQAKLEAIIKRLG